MENLSSFLTWLIIIIGVICGYVYFVDFKFINLRKRLWILLVLFFLIVSNLGVLNLESPYLIVFELASIVSFLVMFLVLGYLKAFKILVLVEGIYFVFLLLGRHFLETTLEGYVCLMIAFLIKLAVFPVFLWLPILVRHLDAITSALLICLFEIVDFALLLKVCYNLEKFYPQGFLEIKPMLIMLGIFTLFIGAILAFFEGHLRKLLAYATVDDTGYLIISLGIFSCSSLAGGVILWINHVIAKFGLFFIVYFIEKVYKRETLKELGGLFKGYPDLAFGFLISALTLIGVPPFPGFWGKLLIYQEFFKNLGLLSILMIVGSSLTLIYFVKAYHQIFLGSSIVEREEVKNFLDFSRLLVVFVGIFILIGVFITIWGISYYFKKVF